MTAKYPNYDVFIQGLDSRRDYEGYSEKKYINHVIENGNLLEEIRENYRRLDHLYNHVKSKKGEDRKFAIVHVKQVWKRIKSANLGLERILKENRQERPLPDLNPSYAY